MKSSRFQNLAIIQLIRATAMGRVGRRTFILELFELGENRPWLLQLVLKPVLEFCPLPALSDILHGCPQIREHRKGGQACEGSGNHQNSGSDCKYLAQKEAFTCISNIVICMIFDE